MKRVEKKRKSVQEKKKEEKRKIKTEYARAERVTVVERVARGFTHRGRFFAARV